MLSIAQLPDHEREDLFTIAAQSMGVPPAIIEKDFWVCYLLDHLFHRSEFGKHLVFKGGTSLSKCYHLINRFSEDIDLILDWREIGYTLREPWTERSHGRQDAFKLDTIKRTNDYLAQKFVPVLQSDLSLELGYELSVYPSHEEETVIVQYPKIFQMSATLDVIRLEIGPLAAWTPTEEVRIQAYLAEQRPVLFRAPRFSVQTVKPERTFWEKATILHQEHHRPQSKRMLPRYSRHYYDLFQLSASSVKAAALNNLPLLGKVVTFKEKFYRTPWARLHEAVPGSFRLTPPLFRIDELQKDYASMSQMLIGQVPAFKRILDDLSTLENEINQKA